MKKLNLLDQSTSFKVNDTGTIIPFNAYEDSQPVFATSDDTVTFRIKNEMGFLKAVNATVATGGYIFELNTKDLVGLVPGTYEIELSITNNRDNEESIFPDTGFCSFTINESALTVTGTQIPTMSLDSFKQQLEQYVQAQTATKIQGIEDDFKTYVASVKEGPQGETGPAGNDGKAATITIGTTTTADVGESANVTNSGTDNNAVLNFTIPRGEQGPKGDTGESTTLSLGNTTTFNPYICFDSAGKDYFKGWVSNSATENVGTNDITTDYFQVYANDIYTVSLPATLPTLADSRKLRICWFDSNKNFIKQDEIIGLLTYPYNFTKTAPKDGFARVCVWVGDNSNMTGNNQHIIVTDSGHPLLDNSGNSNDAVFDFRFSAGIPGLQGPQGIQGEQGPQGTIGDYGVFTGWLDLTPYMDFDNVWNTPDSSTYCRYAVTSFNSQNILWVRIHAKLRDASVATKYGTTLFTLPQDVRSQYGHGEWNQFNSMYETCGTPCLYSFNKSAGKVVTQGYIPAINGSSTMSAPSGTNKDCNLYAWFIL